MSNTLTNTLYGNTLIYSGSSTISTTNPNYNTISVGSTGLIYSPYIVSTDPYEYSELSNINYDIDISDDNNGYLKNNIVSINGKLLIFNCDFDDKKRIQPYELIMKMISEKRKFNITIKVGDILTIKYQGVKFKRIENNLSFVDNTCSFNTLKVKIKSKNVVYENHRLHITEKRKEKLEKLMEL